MIGLFPLVVLVIVLVIPGCTREPRHAVLSFFFDGVPPLDAGLEIDEPLDSAETDIPKVVRLVMLMHKPLEDGLCDRCHRKERSLYLGEEFDIRGRCFECHEPLQEQLESYPFIHGPVAVSNCLGCHDAHESPYPPLLIQPDPELCYGCHDQELVVSLPSHQDWSEEKCMPCHDPHGGDTRFFLKEVAKQ